MALKYTLSPSLRFIPSSSKRENACTVVSCLSSSLMPSGDSLDQATIKPTELFVMGTSKEHRRNTLPSSNSATISGVLGGGSNESGDCEGAALPNKTKINGEASCHY